MTAKALPIIGAYDPVKAGARCDLCPLRGNNVVPPKASLRPAKLVFVGEAPGRKEEFVGQPFVGQTGSFLRGLCREVGIDFTEAALQNAALCRSNLDKENELAATYCAPRLLKELAALDPSIPIVTLGKTSTLSVLGVRSVMRARGFVWTAREIDPAPALNAAKKAELRGAPKQQELRLKAQITEGRSKLAGRAVLPTVHPAFVLRSDTWLPILKGDLDRVARWVRGDLTRDKLLENGPYVVVSKGTDIRREFKKLAPVISVDIETGPSQPGGPDGADPNRNRILCVGVSDGEHTVVIWPWRKATHAPLLNALFRRVKAIGMHNGYNFDQISLARAGVPFEPIEDKLEDTLLAHHTFASHMPQRLAHVASIFVDSGPWKVTFKQGSGGATEKGLPPEKLSGEELCRYNCLPGNTRVLLADGTVRSIGQIVRQRERPLVLSYSKQDGIIARRVVGWSYTRVVGQKWWAVATAARPQEQRRLISTPDHKLFLRRGWVEACDVKVGDELALPERQMSAEQRDALLGSLLGDSSLTTSPSWRKKKHWPVAAVVGGHTDSVGLTQAKVRALSGLLAFSHRVQQRGGSYPGSKPIRRYGTTMRHDVTEFRSMYDRNGLKRLTIDTLDRLGPIGFAWWFADDGCRAAKTVRLATNGFPESDVERARAWFTKRFGPTSIVNGGVLALGRAASDAFCTLIAPHLFPCVRYKLPPHREWPKYIDRTFESDGQPTFARVTSSSPFKPTGPWWQKHSGAHRRYCLTVEKDHNFFTVNGLVANSADARIQAQVWLRMQADLASEQDVYEVDKANARLCRGMIIGGIGVDLARREQLRDAITEKEGDLLDKMRKLLRRANFHPMQLSEVRKALFTILGAPLEAADPTESGLPSTSQRTLERLKESPTRAGRFADLLLQWRGAVKIKSTYINSQVLDAPRKKAGEVGRTHFNWRSYGAASGRYSCRLQSCPRAEYLKDKSIVLETRVRELYIARPGCKLIYFDLSQAELRFAAYLSGDKSFVAACESGDVHTATAKLLFPAEAELIGRDPKGAGKPFRDVEKNSIFGFCYYAEPGTVFGFVRSKGLPVEMRDVLLMHDMIRQSFADYFRYVEQNKRWTDQHGYLRCALSGRISWLGWHAGFPDVANRPIQGGIASLMNVRLPAIARRLPPGARVVAQIHDAAIVEVPERYVERVRKLVQATWEEPVVIPANGYGTSLRVEDGARSFVMPIDLKIGERWSDFG